MATVIIKRPAAVTRAIVGGPTGHPYNPTSIAPSTGVPAGGTPFTLTGTNFTTATGVTFNGLPCTSFVLVGSTSITGVTPVGAVGAATVLVTGPSGCNPRVDLFAYAAPATASVSAISPSIGFYDGGDTVTLTVSSSTGATGATIGGVALTSFAIVDPTHVSGKTGAHARGTGLQAIVTNGAGAGPAGGTFEYFDPTSPPGASATCVTYYTARHCTQGAGIITAMPDSKGTNTGVITGGQEPGYTAANASYNNYPTMDFPAADTKRVATTNAGGIAGATPNSTVTVGSISGNGARLFSDNAGNLEITQQPGALDCSGDGTVTSVVGVTTTSPQVLVFVDNAAGSKLFQSAQTPITGTTAVANLTGLTLGIGNYAAGYAAGFSQNGSTAEWLLFSGALSTSDADYVSVGYGKIYNITIGP